MKRFTLLVAVLLLALGTARLAAADVVTDWNHNLQAAVFTGGTNAIVATRVAAIVHSAMFDALNGIERRYAPVHVDFAAPPGASRRAAIIQAAYATLVALYPSQKPDLDAKRAVSLASIVDDPSDVESSQSIARGIAWGQTVADDIMAWRATDGFSPPPPPFMGGLLPGEWRPTPPANAPGLVPQLGSTTPWVVQSGAQFRPPGPPDLTSAQYTSDYDQVKDIGSLTSASRASDQTNAALYWQSPTMWWDRVAQAVLANRHTTLSENARLFALMHLAIADATICCWEAKYHYVFWRPITAIRLGSTDNNPDTAADPLWTPLITTPAFPEYPSGHAAVSPAAGVVLQALLGDSGPFTIDGNATTITRSFTSFDAAVNDAFYARIWGGIHFFTACNDAHALGTSVGDYVLANALLPLNGKKLGQTTHNHGAGNVIGQGEISGGDGL